LRGLKQNWKEKVYLKSGAWSSGILTDRHDFGGRITTAERDRVERSVVTSGDAREGTSWGVSH